MEEEERKPAEEEVPALTARTVSPIGFCLVVLKRNNHTMHLLNLKILSIISIAGSPPAACPKT